MWMGGFGEADAVAFCGVTEVAFLVAEAIWVLGSMRVRRTPSCTSRAMWRRRCHSRSVRPDPTVLSAPLRLD